MKTLKTLPISKRQATQALLDRLHTAKSQHPRLVFSRSEIEEGIPLEATIVWDSRFHLITTRPLVVDIADLVPSLDGWAWGSADDFQDHLNDLGMDLHVKLNEEREEIAWESWIEDQEMIAKEEIEVALVNEIEVMCNDEPVTIQIQWKEWNTWFST